MVVRMNFRLILPKRMHCGPYRGTSGQRSLRMSLSLGLADSLQTFAAEISGRNQSQFSRLLSVHQDLAKDSLTDLSKKIGKAVTRFC